jgi:hypothetical protein
MVWVLIEVGRVIVTVCGLTTAPLPATYAKVKEVGDAVGPDAAAAETEDARSSANSSEDFAPSVFMTPLSDVLFRNFRLFGRRATQYRSRI